MPKQDEAANSGNASAAPPVRPFTTEEALDAVLSMAEEWSEGDKDSSSERSSGSGSRTFPVGLYSVPAGVSG